jgi:two-component system sensor histidine kinase KdpD
VTTEAVAAPGLPRPAGGLSPARRWIGVGITVLGLPALTLVLHVFDQDVSLGSVLLLYLLTVVVVAAVGGWWSGAGAAVASVLVANWYFTPPYHTFVVEGRDSIIELVVFGIVAVIVSAAVELAARDRSRATRSRIEADLVADVAARPVDDLHLPEVLDRVRSMFGMTSAALVRAHGASESVVAAVGPPVEIWSLRVPASAELSLVLAGPELFAEDRSVLERLAAAAARAWETQHLTTLADQLASADQVRSALLAAVGHDLRTPLSSLKAAVSSLRQDDVQWAPDEQSELLATIEESADRLDDLIANILDMTRIQVGAITPRVGDVAVDEIVALAAIGLPSGVVQIRIPDDLPLVRVDPGLLERVVANLLDNAVRHSPAGRRVEVGARVAGSGVELRVADHGAGVPAVLWDSMFQPFQRLGDRATGAGAGLGLAIVLGFCTAMDIPVVPAETPGGGLTMALRLPLAPR